MLGDVLSLRIIFKNLLCSEEGNLYMVYIYFYFQGELGLSGKNGAHGGKGEMGIKGMVGRDGARGERGAQVRKMVI